MLSANVMRGDFGGSNGFDAAVVSGLRVAGGSLPDGWRRLALLADLFAWLEFLQRERLSGAVAASAVASLEWTMAELG
jgi:hypothetical protein